MRALSNRRLLFAALAILAAAQARNTWIIHQNMPLVNSDLLVQVIATRDALAGKNPYSDAADRQIQRRVYGRVLRPGSRHDPIRFDYPGLIVPILAPFMRARWAVIQYWFVILAVPGLAAAFYWWARETLPSLRAVDHLSIAAVSLVAWPSVWALRLQQPTVVFFVLVTLACLSAMRGQYAISGACMAVSLIKPQLAVPLALWMLVWTIRKRRWIFPAAMGASLALLGLVSAWMFPGWLVPWLQNLRAYTHLAQPVYFAVAGVAMGSVVTFLVAATSLPPLWRLLTAPVQSRQFIQGAALSLAATLILTPVYSATVYDQIFLMPSAALLVSARPKSAGAQLLRWAAIICLAATVVCPVICAALSIFLPRVPLPVLCLYFSFPLFIFGPPAVAATAIDTDWAAAT